MSLFSLPKTATAPFCPSAVRGTIELAPGLSGWRKVLLFAGPGLLVSVGYMDPGNWATDIEAGSRYGYTLLWVVAASSLAAIVLQYLAMRLGLATGKDLARLSRDHYPRSVNVGLWLFAELAIVACDVAEVLGGALAFHLLLGCSLAVGVLLTALDTLIVIGLKENGFRKLEAIMLGLVATVTACFVAELAIARPQWSDVAGGLIPTPQALRDPDMLYLAIGILGATVMPHNLYLHSSIVQTRRVGEDVASRREAIRLSRVDTVVSLLLAMLVNCAILVVAGQVFHGSGHTEVTAIDDAYRLLDPLLGSGLAAAVFAIALLASGQSATFTGTIVGQILMEGFLDLKIPCWQRHVITRFLALAPALAGVLILGPRSVGTLLVASQVVLSLQLPFALFPLLQLNGRRRLMGPFTAPMALRLIGWALFALITAANLWLLRQWL